MNDSGQDFGEDHNPKPSAAIMKSSQTFDAINEASSSIGLLDVPFGSSDARDLQVALDNPQKHVTPFETYVTYRVSTKTSRAEFNQQEYVVRRRYSDFVWMRQQLLHAYPTHIIPPLPEKHGLLEQMDRYDHDFIHCRMQLLNRFLNRVADHPVLSCDKHYCGFLTESQTDFSVLKKTSSSPGFLGRVSESLHNIATAYVAKDRTTEFEKMNEYLDKLLDKIQMLSKIGQRVVKERQAYMQEMQQLQPILSQWASQEADLCSGLQALGDAAMTCSQAQKDLITNYRETVAMPLHEYELFIAAAKEALNHRDSSQIDYEVHMEQLCRVKTEQNQLQTQSISDQPIMFGLNMWRSPEEVQRQRLQQLTAASEQLVQQVEASRDKMECANENLRADFEQWNNIKTRDFKRMLTEMADQHIALYEKCMAAWSAVLPNLKNNEA